MLTDDDRDALERIASSDRFPIRWARRAHGVLLAARGLSDPEVARHCGISPDTVRRWRAHFSRHGIAGVCQLRPGEQSTLGLPAETVSAIVDDTVHEAPTDGSLHWTAQALAARHGVAEDDVARIWRLHQLKPYAVRQAGPSAALPMGDDTALVGLFLNPPERAFIACQPEDTAHGFTSAVLNDERTRNPRDFLFFLKSVAIHIPSDRPVHLVLDSYTAHMSHDVVVWLSHPKRARWCLYLAFNPEAWEVHLDRLLRSRPRPGLGDVLDRGVGRWLLARPR